MNLDLTYAEPLPLLPALLVGVALLIGVVGVGLFAVGPRRVSAVGIILIGVGAAIGVADITATMHGADSARAGNVATMQREAARTYGLHLSVVKAKQLLGAKGVEGYAVDGRYGQVLTLQGGNQVREVSLVHVDGRWLLLNAGTQRELPHA